MVIVVLVLIVVVAGGIIYLVARRSSGNDLYSVRNYHNALGTLESLSDRIGPPNRPVVRPLVIDPADPDGKPVRLPVPPVKVRGSDEFPDPDAPIVFDDARPVDRPPVGEAGESGVEGASDAGRLLRTEGPTVPPRPDRSQRVAIDSMLGHRRPGTIPLIVALVLVVFVALAIVGSHHGKSTAATSTSTSRVTEGTGSRTTTRTTTAKHRPTRPTPTTLPSQYVATTSSSDGTGANYTVPSTSYQLTVTGTGSCWVQVISAATGNTLWAGALSAGTVQNIPATGTTTVQFGTPTLTLAVGDIPVVLPTPLRTPFVATFSPASSGGNTATSETTTTTTTSTTTTTTSTTSPGA